MVRLVKIEADGEKQSIDVATITRPDDLVEIAHLGLTLAEGKRLLAGLQQEIVAAQARGHAVRRPDCRSCGAVCHVKDYRDHAVATLFGQVRVRLPRFRCAGCGGIEAGLEWPSHGRSTPELDQLQAHLSALMTYRMAAEVMVQMFPRPAKCAGNRSGLRAFLSWRCRWPEHQSASGRIGKRCCGRCRRPARPAASRCACATITAAPW